MIYYQASWRGIIKVLVEKESYSSVWVDGRRSNRTSNYESYHTTYKEARDYLIKQQQMNIDSAKKTLLYQKIKMQELLAKVPENEPIEQN